LMINPVAAFPTVPAGGMYDGSTYANSGIMSTDPGQLTQFSLTFTQAGNFTYECLVHGVMMSGTIMVVNPSVPIPTPAMVSNQAKRTLILKLARAQMLIGTAMSKVPHPQHNANGTTTYTVLIGWAKGQSELMRFFPKKQVVHPGDTVVFMLSPTNDAPHTVTFLNGADDIPFIVPVPNPPGPPYLLVNPEILAPIQPGVPLTNTGIFSSALMGAGPGPTSYILTIGATSGSLSYQCVVHDTSGMEGVLKVVPK
jgi:plastocyanin